MELTNETAQIQSDFHPLPRALPRCGWLHRANGIARRCTATCHSERAYNHGNNAVEPHLHATLPPQRRLRWICRAMARELGASTRRLKRRGSTGIEPMRIKDQATQ